MRRLLVNLLEDKLGLTDGLYETFIAITIAALDPRSNVLYDTAKEIHINTYLEDDNILEITIIL